MRIKKLLLFVLVVLLLLPAVAMPVSISADTGDKGLVLYYSFSNIVGKTVVNGAATGNKYNATIVGDVNVTTKGKLGTALDIYGQGLGGSAAGSEIVSRIEIPAEILKEFKNGVTFAFLINPDSTENSVIMTTGYWDDQVMGFINFWLSHSTADSVGPHFAYQSFSATDQAQRDHLKTTEELQLGQWQWLIFTMDDNNNATLYIDDKVIGTKKFGYHIRDLAGGLDFDGNNIIAIGSSSIFPNDSGGNFLLDEVYMYNYALSADEIKALVKSTSERESQNPETPPKAEESPTAATKSPSPQQGSSAKPSQTASTGGQASQVPGTASPGGVETSDNTALIVIIVIAVIIVFGTAAFFAYKKLKK